MCTFVHLWLLNNDGTMNRLSTKFKIGAGVATTLVIHAAAIEAQRYARGIEPEFKQGSADDMLADSLNSGDVVLFNRRWYTYHIPTAFLVKAQKAVFGGEYDHSGVIVMKSGTPYILEKTPLHGVKCEKFEDRVRASSAASIIVLKLDRTKELSTAQSQNLREFAQAVSSTQNTFGNSELVGLAERLLRNVYAKVLGSGISDQFYCTNAELVAQAADSMGLRLQHAKGRKPHEITLEDLHDRNVVLKSHSGYISFDRDDVHVRS